MKKVLHIQGRALQHASLDGKALKITLSGQSPLRFPLTRISRITVSGRCNVPIEVFIYCVTRQIPVTFFDGHGHIRGQLLPHLRQPEPLGFYLEQLPYHSGFKTVYALWLDNQRRHVLKQVGMENGVPKLRAKQFHDAVVLMMKTMHCKDAFNQGIAWLLGFYRAHLNQIFHNAGIMLARPESVDLQLDFEQITLPLLQDWCGEHLQNVKPNIQAPDARWALSIYHQHQDELEHLIQSMLNQLLWQFEQAET